MSSGRAVRRASHDSMSLGAFVFLADTEKTMRGGKLVGGDRGHLDFANAPHSGLATILYELGNFQHYLAACVSRLVEFVGASSVREGQHGFDHWFQFPSIDELCNLRQL